MFILGFGFINVFAGTPDFIKQLLIPNSFSRDEIRGYVDMFGAGKYTVPQTINESNRAEFERRTGVKITDEQIRAYDAGAQVILTPEQKKAALDAWNTWETGGGNPTTINVDNINNSQSVDPNKSAVDKPQPADPSKSALENMQYPWQGAKDPADLVGRFYKIALGLVGAAALGVLIYGSIVYSLSGAVTSKQDAMEWISGALWGLALLLGAYLILSTINPQLVKLKNPIMPAGSSAQTPNGSSYTKTSTSGLSESSARDQLRAANIGVNANPPKTSLEDIKQSTIDEVISLKKQLPSGTSVIITGGTENGPHSSGELSHGNGYKVDLALNPNLNNYIENNFTKMANRSDGAPQYKNPASGTIYAKEGNHWDVLVK